MPGARSLATPTSPTFHPCRGTSSTCGISEAENMDPKTGRPCSTSCWRLAFRFHQEECKATKGFMIQVEEPAGLGDGQKIETEMARQVGLKLFRTYTNYTLFQYEDGSSYAFDGMAAISKAVKEWYESGCSNKDLENIFIGGQKLAEDFPGNYGYSVRPRYEKL